MNTKRYADLVQKQYMKVIQLLEQHRYCQEDTQVKIQLKEQLSEFIMLLREVFQKLKIGK